MTGNLRVREVWSGMEEIMGVAVGATDRVRVARLRQDRLRRLLCKAADLSTESQQMLVAVADGCRRAERLPPTAGEPHT